MSDSWPLRDKQLLFVLIPCMLAAASAYELSATPYELTIRSRPSQEVCKEITVSSDDGALVFESWWSQKKSKNLADFSLNAEEAGIEATLSINNVQGGNLEVCITAHDSYAYHGVILITNPEKHATLGVWVYVNEHLPEKPFPEAAHTKQASSRITGRVISDTESTPTQPPWLILIGAGSALVLATLLVAIYRRSKPRGVV